MGETSKAHERRLREGWYDKFIKEPVIDIGAGIDPIPVGNPRKWDNFWTGGSDATFMDGIEDNSYNTVYASHILEHIEDPETAIRNWFRILKPNGHLIIIVPHRDLYEKKKELPSRWNPRNRVGDEGHAHFWMPYSDEPPHTRGLQSTIYRALNGQKFDVFRDVFVRSDGYDHSLPPDVHPVGEYSIEQIIKKLP